MAAVEEESKENPLSNAHVAESQRRKDRSPHSLDDGIVDHFDKLWRNAVDDNYLTLYGFRRYRTSHLLNLRFLEAEIDKIDHAIFQAGLSLDHLPVLDKLGLKDAKKDATPVIEIVDKTLILQLRELLKQYGKSTMNMPITCISIDSRFTDEALISFNYVKLMETFSLSDNPSESNARNDLNPYETYKTRLVRVDLAPRSSSRDPFQHYIRKCLRTLWYSTRSTRNLNKDEESGIKSPISKARAMFDRSYQNTARVAEAATRFLIAVFTGSFLVVPLIVLSFQTSKESHLVTVSVCIVVFSLLISLLSKASNYETMAASAAYAAVLAVFVSGNE